MDEENGKMVEEKKKEENNNVENKKEAKKSKKKIIIPIVIIVILILIAIGSFVYYHATQIGKLITEVNRISSLELVDVGGNVTDEPIGMELKTKGSYAVVEETLKDYLNDVLEETKNLTQIFNEDKMVKLTSFDTIKEDGPDFIKTKEEIANLRETANDYLEKMESFSSEDYMFSKIEVKDISNYYKELYKNLITDEMSNDSMEKAMEELKSAKEDVDVVLNELESIFDFLSENKNKWEIEGEQIIFTDESVYREYTNLMASLEIMQ